MLKMYYECDGVKVLEWGTLFSDCEGHERAEKLWKLCGDNNTILDERGMGGSTNSVNVSNNFIKTLETSKYSSVKMFADNLTNAGIRAVELFIDSDLKQSVGYKIAYAKSGVWRYLGLYPLDVKRNNPYGSGGLLMSAQLRDSFETAQFVSPYSSSSGTLDGFLENMWHFEHDQFINETPSAVYMMGGHCCSTPFGVLSTYVPEDVNLFPYAKWMVAGSSSTHVWDNYASHYTIMKGVQLVPVDEMNIGGFKFRPAVMYNPKYITQWNYSEYGYDSVITTDVDKIPPGISDVIVKTNDKISPTKTVKASRFITAYMQIPTQMIGSEFNKVIDMPYTSSPVNFLFTKSKSPKMVGMGITNIESHDRAFITMCFAQIRPEVNLSKKARDADDSTDFWKVKIGTSTTMPPIVGVSLRYDSDVNKLIASGSNYFCAPAGMALFSYDGFEPLTGKEAFDFFYNGVVQDWNPPEKPSKPDDIPPDNGNGGFNNTDYIGGNGVWSDTTVDMSPDRNSPIWNIPNNLGLDGNYDIVKLSRSSMESLASQTWTDKGWLDYLKTFSTVSRAGDGVVDVKTCFADIPSKGAAKIVAIAGFGIQSPIPCTKINQYNEFNFGTVDVPVYFGSFLDYSPYTEIVLELPFAQPVTIPPEIVVGKSIGLKLYADVMSNSAMYIVHCDGRLIAQVPADIFIHLPFSSSEYTQSAASAASGYIANASNIGSMVGKTAGAAVGAIANPAGPAVGAAVEGISIASSGVNEVVTQSANRNITQISQGGGPGGVGAMCTKYAVLKISRPYVTIPPRYYELNGCPSGFVKTVGECKGYLEVGAIYGNIKCNTEEFSMITNVLAGGVFP